MRKIIASLWKTVNSEIAQNAARAPYFLVFENDTFVEAIKNPFTIWGWAWFATAELLQEKKCDLFVAGNIWWNLKNELERYGIKYEIKN